MSPTILWLTAGAIFIGVEILGIPGIGFLFAGIAALIVGGGIEFGLIANDNYLVQSVLFLVITCISAASLWKKLKAERPPAYSNIIGTEALVAEPGLIGNKEGQIKWSGTLMRAKLIENDGLDVVAADTAVIIERLDGNIAFVTPKK